MRPKMFQWIWGARTVLFNCTQWNDYEQRSYGLRVGRRFFGVVLTRHEASRG